MKYKHIIWDWNGTLVDDTWLFVDIMNGVLKNRNLNRINLSPISKFLKISEIPL